MNDNQKLPILLLGQKPIADQAFKILFEDDFFELVGIVSNQEPVGWWNSNQLYKESVVHDIPFLDNICSQREIEDFTRQANPFALISIQHPNRIENGVVDLVNGQAWNLHLAPLPEFRGWNGASHAILNDASNFGSTLHWISEGLDEGDIVFRDEFLINPSDTASSLYRKASELGINLIQRLVDALKTGEVPRSKQQGKHQYYSRTDINAYKDFHVNESIETIWKKSRSLYFPPMSDYEVVINGIEYKVIPDENGLRFLSKGNP